MQPEVLQILQNARDLIGDEFQWTKGAAARDEDGRAVYCGSDSAASFSANGALMRAQFNLVGLPLTWPDTDGDMRIAQIYECQRAIRKARGGHSHMDTEQWNDYAHTAHGDVMAAFDHAIATAADVLHRARRIARFHLRARNGDFADAVANIRANETDNEAAALAVRLLGDAAEKARD